MPDDAVPAQPRSRRAQVRPDAGARRADDAGVLEHLAAGLDDDARAAAQLHALAERAARRNLRIGYEALAWGRHVNHYGRRGRSCDAPSIRTSASSSTASTPCRWATIPPASPTFPGEKIFFLQMADAPLLAMDVLQWARHHRNFPGPGPVRPAAISRAGAASPATPDRCRSRSSTTCSAKRRTGAPRSTRCGRCSISRAGAAAARAAPRRDELARRRANARVRRSASSCSIRRRPRSRRLRVPRVRRRRGDRAAARTACSRRWASGAPAAIARRTSRCTGRARSTSSSTPSPIRSRAQRFDVHGPSVCAIGLATDDPRSARATARRRCSRRASTAGSGPASCSVPAVVAPAAASSTSCQRARVGRAVRDRLRPRRRGSGGRPDAGLTRVDHVALGLPATSSTPGSCSAAPCSGWSPARASSWPTRSAWSAAAASPTPIAACAWCSTSR